MRTNRLAVEENAGTSIARAAFHKGFRLGNRDSGDGSVLGGPDV